MSSHTKRSCGGVCRAGGAEGAGQSAAAPKLGQKGRAATHGREKRNVATPASLHGMRCVCVCLRRAQCPLGNSSVLLRVRWG